MSRVAYCATKDVFLSDVRLNRFIPKMREGALLNHIGSSDSEIRSWQSNAPNVRNLLEESSNLNSVAMVQIIILTGWTRCFIKILQIS